MYPLADYVMRGRSQAVFVGLVLGILPLVGWISAAVLGLVTLRRGISEGLLLLPWLVLPAIGWLLATGNPAGLAVLSLVLVMSGMLHGGRSWRHVLGAGLLMSCLISVVQMYWLSDLIALIVGLMEEVLSGMVADSGGEAVVIPTPWLVSNSLAAVFFWCALGVMAMARSCQAKLYNPGGFRTEFQAIRLPLWAGVAMLLMIAAVNLTTTTVASFLPLLEIPYVFAGLSLVHGLAALKQANQYWLVFFYVALLLMAPIIYGLLVLLAVLDSWMDFRKRSESRRRTL